MMVKCYLTTPIILFLTQNYQVSPRFSVHIIRSLTLPRQSGNGDGMGNKHLGMQFLIPDRETTTLRKMLTLSSSRNGKTSVLCSSS